MNNLIQTKFTNKLLVQRKITRITFYTRKNKVEKVIDTDSNSYYSLFLLRYAIDYNHKVPKYFSVALTDLFLY